jgi:hypothetical protein
VFLLGESKSAVLSFGEMLSLLLQRRRVKLTPEETSDFYAEHYGKPDFSSMIAYMSRVRYMLLPKPFSLYGLTCTMAPVWCLLLVDVFFSMAFKRHSSRLILPCVPKSEHVA